MKADTVLGTKKFNVADHCMIVLNVRTDAGLRDLKPGDRLTFSYDEVEGVNIVNRIATADRPSETVTAQSK